MSMSKTLRVRTVLAGLAALLALPVVAAAQAPSVTVDQLACIPLEGNAVVHANISGLSGGYTARVYFRRLNNVVEDFYFVTLLPSGGTTWWSSLPKAEDHTLPAMRLEPKSGQSPPQYPWAAWWRAKEASENRNPNGDLDEDVIHERAWTGKNRKRDWMSKMSDEDLQHWLEGLENEPAEYFVAVFDSFGKPVPGGISQMRVAPVKRDCNVPLSPVEAGEAANLTVGETAPWEQGEAVMHWLCDGVITRVNDLGVMRADEICRACVVAWFDKRDFLIPVAGVAGVSTIVITEAPNPSPTLP
jgi:hypothetical protein